MTSSGGTPKASITHASCSTSFSPGNSGYPVYNSARIHPKQRILNEKKIVKKHILK